MKQVSLIEMDGFLKGKCIPRDLKVNETNAEYLVRKFGELESKIALLEVQLKLSEAAERAWESLMMQACGEDGPKSVADKFAEIESKLETALRECRSAGITIDNIEDKCAELASENAGLKHAMAVTLEHVSVTDAGQAGVAAMIINDALHHSETPATDAFLAEVKTEARKEGAYFVANRMMAAWGAGFIDDTAKNAADIARMILTSTDFMANAPEGDFDRSFSDGILEDIAAQLRKGVQS
ncbi:phage protein [Escherichia coli]|nr:phage protein [Escherichia coli]HAI2326692.1 hypothetical protein [Escherichia coli]